MRTATWNRILEAARERGTADEIAERVGVSADTVRRYLRVQVDRGLVTTSVFPARPGRPRSYRTVPR